MAKRYGFVMLTARCIDCKACTVACRAENEVPIPNSRNWIKSSGITGTFPNLHQTFQPANCMHCDDAPCVRVCPTGASYKREEDGIVLIHEEKCIGCQYCIQACPYGARYLNEETGTVDKCTLCIHRLEKGLEPACVATCLGKARVAGDLNDPTSAVSKLLASFPHYQVAAEAGTGPNIYYIDVPVPADFLEKAGAATTMKVSDAFVPGAPARETGSSAQALASIEGGARRA